MESENGELRLSKSALYALAGIELQATTLTTDLQNARVQI
jgi:hypothetical protein